MSDAIQNITSDELVNDVHVNVTDGTDMSHEHRVKLANKMSDVDHEELTKV